LGRAVADEQALAILYDLALTIGSEVNVAPLMLRTLQRLMYHTGLPVGLWLGWPEEGGKTAVLELAIGDYHLIRRKGERLALPQALLAGPPAMLEAAEMLGALQLRKPLGTVLRLPVPGHGVILLLGASAPLTRLSLPELFSPILERLGRSITLCRSYELEVQHRVEQTAYYDPLTGLPNAILFNTTLQQAVVQARATGRWLALVHLDLDDFRPFNEARGSDLGNQVLIALGQRLGASLHPGELLARIAGDEFVLLLPDLGGWEDVDERIVRILQTNRTPLEVAGEVLDLTFSAGIALLPTDSPDGDTLVRHAQIALHQAKQESRGYFRLFDGDQDRRTHARRELLRRLELALVNREFRLFYQPKVDMPSGRVLGFEALLRWFHPEQGMVPPGDFLPVVENSDFIIALGEWVMREALAQAVSWRIAGLETCISINIAGRHLQLPDFPERVRHALADVPGGRAESLEIEILESSVLEDMAHVRDIMRACSAMGIRFALDDFGTGYSSLAYLHQLPASTIKIDQLFVRNLFQHREDPTIIQAVVQIAEVFGRSLVAEGVEDPEHGMLLVAMGCHVGQGYGIGRPMAAEAVLPWVEGYRARREWTALEGLSWHRGLYDLFHLRHDHRQWREQVSGWLASREDGDAAMPPAFDTCGLSEWLMISAPTGASSEIHECFRLLGRLSEQTAQLAALRESQSFDACSECLGALFLASDALLQLLDALAVRLAGGSST